MCLAGEIAVIHAIANKADGVDRLRYNPAADVGYRLHEHSARNRKDTINRAFRRMAVSDYCERACAARVHAQALSNRRSGAVGR